MSMALLIDITVHVYDQFNYNFIEIKFLVLLLFL